MLLKAFHHFLNLYWKQVSDPYSNSPVHIPILPVKKIRDKGQPDEGCVLEDLHAVNAAVHARAPLISSPYSILAHMSFLLLLLLRNSAKCLLT